MEFDFFKYRNKHNPEKGKILISEPFLPDPNFERSVILLCEHNEGGSFGLVINKTAGVNVGDIVPELIGVENKLFIGGPVQQDSLHFVHTLPDLDGNEVVEGLYWGGDFEKLAFKAETGQLPAENMKFFLGYSGWDAGQLQQELDQDSWIVCGDFTHDLLFNTEPSEIWKKALSEMGGRYALYSRYPSDPRLN